ncbi:unnamed protein product [Phytophthora lilii]|uniref:Unnamed protein product n=1 Tax=Phytophthora lilii TaxID=2077276 RepID=A0A9W6WQG0_9STRA|nr:unnamed protein product [Phytophthora lilii]
MAAYLFPVLWKDAHEPGLKGVIGVHKLDLPLKGARVRDLFPIINKKIRAATDETGVREVKTFLLYGRRVSYDRLLHSLISELGDSPRFVVTMQRSSNRVQLGKTPRHETNVLIIIKTLTNKAIHVRCSLTNTVNYIKARIVDMEKIPMSKQCLIYEGQQLEDHLTLSSYDIQDQSQLHLVQLMRGGGMPSRIFADLSDESLLTELAFTPNAPEWRMASEGLNPEGRCKNRDCSAFGRMIICPKRFEPFNLLQDDKVQCPMCRLKVKPRTCGFYNCTWKFDGTLAGSGFSIISQWQDATGKKYHRFADKAHGSAEWESLLIVAKSRDTPIKFKLSVTAMSANLSRNGLATTDVCAICWSEFGLTQKKFVITISCGHSFYCSCIDKWSGWCNNSNNLPSCPVCRREIKAAHA